jgi:ABC-type amino acid transport system permease subunit
LAADPIRIHEEKNNMVSLPIYAFYDLIVFVLIFAVVYGLLSRFKFFNSSDIPALIALAIGLLSLTSSFFISFIITFLPYVLAILLFIFLGIVLLSASLVSQGSITDYLKKSSLIPAMVIFMMFIFGLIAFGTVSSNYPGVLGVATNSTTTSSSTIAATSSSFPGDLSSTYILTILTSPGFLTTLLTLMAMLIVVFSITRQKPGAR